ARTIENRAHALAARVGPEHRIRRLVDNAGEIAFVLAGGDWAVLAERYGAISRDASLRWGTGQLGAGALAVYALAQLGRREEVEGLLEDFTPALHISRPTDLAHGGCVCNISGAIWDLELRPWAGTYRQLALELLDAGLGDLSGHSKAISTRRSRTSPARAPFSTEAASAPCARSSITTRPSSERGTGFPAARP